MKRKTPGKHLARTLICGAFTLISYLIAVLMSDKTLYALFSGLYFCGVSFTVCHMLQFLLVYTGRGINALPKWFRSTIFAFLVLDVVAQLCNPFTFLVIDYQPVAERAVSCFRYDMKLPYQIHLFFNYTVVGIAMTALVTKSIIVPKGYKRQYIMAIVIILAIVGINAVYLYSPVPEITDFFDYSLLGYSLAGAVFYWLIFIYGTNGLLASYDKWIIDTIDQGVLLFDYEDRLLLYNEKAASLLHGCDCDTGMQLSDFCQKMHFDDRQCQSNDTATFVIYHGSGEQVLPIRCDYHVLRVNAKKPRGRMFVLTPMDTERDLLTGFNSINYFRHSWQKIMPAASQATSVVICDINGLSDINEIRGRIAGDFAVQQLANSMTAHFPSGTVFVRCREAYLAAFCPGTPPAQVDAVIEKIQSDLQTLPQDKRFSIQSAVTQLPINARAPEAISRTMRVLRIKKLMDHSAHHSDLLNSIIEILQECDSDTEAHVRRTQKLCVELGRRIGLTDDELSRLALLAILHDIGKVGVPLDVLNKPGKLTPAEWNAIKSHVEKGARIASSSIELREIADLILYHHERWDGKGYPAGLSKESIPLPSRIIAVVDSYDAMVNNRSYRKALDERFARAELRRCAGTQFDPAIVSAFLELLEAQEDAGSHTSLAEMPFDGMIQPPELAVAEWSTDAISRTTEAEHVHPMEFGHYMMNQQGYIKEVDRGFEMITGYTSDDVNELQLRQNDLIPEQDWLTYVGAVAEIVKTKAAAYIEHRLRRADGTVINVFCLGRDYFNSAERASYTEIYITDVASSYAIQSLLDIEHSKALRRLEIWENKYRQDSLTGLLSHESFRNDVQMKLLNGTNRGMMLMFDLDHFKQYNDTFGHRAGDEFLIVVAQTLAGLVKEEDFVCRMGGDEFAASLFFAASTTDKEMIHEAQSLWEKLSTLILSKTGSMVSVSAGGAIMTKDSTFDSLYEASDKALYRSKDAGRNCFSM